jgi:hypothetical protein
MSLQTALSVSHKVARFRDDCSGTDRALPTRGDGSLYAVAHRDHIYLSLLSPFFDFYQGVLLNRAWLIAMFDEARGARMRW